VKLAYNF